LRPSIIQTQKVLIEKKLEMKKRVSHSKPSLSTKHQTSSKHHPTSSTASQRPVQLSLPYSTNCHPASAFARPLYPSHIFSYTRALSLDLIRRRTCPHPHACPRLRARTEAVAVARTQAVGGRKQRMKQRIDAGIVRVADGLGWGLA
jgi:hypothetical protein